MAINGRRKIVAPAQKGTAQAQMSIRYRTLSNLTRRNVRLSQHVSRLELNRIDCQTGSQKRGLHKQKYGSFGIHVVPLRNDLM
jgi:hypothetical protein